LFSHANYSGFWLLTLVELWAFGQPSADCTGSPIEGEKCQVRWPEPLGWGNSTNNSAKCRIDSRLSAKLRNLIGNSGWIRSILLRELKINSCEIIWGLCNSASHFRYQLRGSNISIQQKRNPFLAKIWNCHLRCDHIMNFIFHIGFRKCNKKNIFCFWKMLILQVNIFLVCLKQFVRNFWLPPKHRSQTNSIAFCSIIFIVKVESPTCSE